MVRMINSHHTSGNSSSNYEQRDFWIRILEEQRNSGIGIPKFCQQKQLNISSFRYWKYKKQYIDKDAKLKSISSEPDNAKFIPVKIADAVSSNDDSEKISSNNDLRLTIIFSNGHKLLLPSKLPEANLLAIIKTIAGLSMC